MARPLELPSSLTAQQAMLLEKLPGWNTNQLEKKLKSLEKKHIVMLTNNSSTVRKIFLERLSAIPDLDDKEKLFWLLLRIYIKN